jgi:hypothetical protein
MLRAHHFRRGIFTSHCKPWHDETNGQGRERFIEAATTVV